jgi:mannose-6-phosphate isomerase-like protein (cupin superfamily)
MENKLYFGMAPQSISLHAKFSAITDHWSPKLIAELNGQHVRLAKVKGEFIWHKHDDADELFFVVKGLLTIRMRDSDVTLNENELFVVPRGVEHKPVAEDECWIMLFGPANTLNTGDQHNERTVEKIERI